MTPKVYRRYSLVVHDNIFPLLEECGLLSIRIDHL